MIRGSKQRLCDIYQLVITAQKLNTPADELTSNGWDSRTLDCIVKITCAT